MGNLISIDAAEIYVKDIFTHLPQNLLFHNWQHTAEVVDKVMKIGTYNQLDDVSITLLKIAALFHDTGYIESYHNHEDNSIKIAKKFFSEFDLDKNSLTAVIDCIEATKLPQSPRSYLAEILCDADLAHFGSPDYISYAARLRQEWSIWLNRNYGDKAWNNENLKVLREHKYKTEYGRKYLQPVKEQNILLIETEASKL